MKINEQKNKMFRLLSAMSVSFSLTFLSACSQHENPLLKSEAVEFLKVQILNVSPSSTCVAFAADPSAHESESTICQAWLESQYKEYNKEQEEVAGALGVKAAQPSLEDFSDPVVWQAVTALLQQDKEAASALKKSGSLTIFRKAKQGSQE